MKNDENDKPVTRLSGIDAFRYISFVFIVILHCLPSAQDRSIYTTLLDHLTRFAVPFFFIASGYFTGRGDPDFASGFVKLFKRLSVVFFFWVFIYVVAKGELKYLDNPKYLLKLMISGGPAFHLWFLPALGMGTAIILFLKRYGWHALISAALVLFAVGMAFGPYRTVLGLPDTHFNTRNGPFFATGFLLIGYYLARKKIDFDMKIGVVLVIAGIILQLAEAQFIAFLADAPLKAYDFLTGTFVYGAGVFIIALNMPALDITKRIARLGELSLGMYCIHVQILYMLRPYLDRHIPIENIAKILLTIIIATLVNFILVRIPYLRKVVK